MSDPTVCFPSDIDFQWPFKQGPTFKTFTQVLTDGSMQVRPLWRASGVQMLTLPTVPLYEDDHLRVGAFLASLRGGAVPYFLFLPDNGSSYASFSIGNSDNTVNQQIQIPFLLADPGDVSDVRVNGVSKPFVATPGVGTFDEAQIQINGGPFGVHPVVIDLIGRLRLSVRGGDSDAVATLMEEFSPPAWQYTLHVREI